MNRIVDVVTGYWASRTLLTALELQVFTRLGSGSKDAASLVEELGLHGRGARDFLDSLVAMGFLVRDGDRYANTRESRMFLDRNKSLYVGGSFEMSMPRLWGAWAGLTEALRTGKPQYDGADDKNLFESLYGDADQRERFLRAMAGSSVVAAMALARHPLWRTRSSFVDLGSALGEVPVRIAKAHPHLRGIGFDLPAVRESFEANVAEHSLGERLRFHGGDFFVDPVPSADVIILGHVLHDWDQSRRDLLISRVYDALPDGGLLLIYEALIDDDRDQNVVALLMSLNMLVDTPVGANFTGAECTQWLRRAGFSEVSVESLAEPDSLVVAVK